MRHVFLHQNSNPMQATQSTIYEPYSACKMKPRAFYNKETADISSNYRRETSETTMGAVPRPLNPSLALEH